jgi:arylsulfotransferase ASST/concanavalin A-like lectin/glucanase superfamily protein/carbohydrate binding protein with CBM4/9 domain/dockerin type I repeat protein
VIRRGSSLVKRIIVLSALALATGPVWADITNNLVAYYNFEGLSGIVGETVVDQSGNGHDGICRQDQSTLKAPTIVSGPPSLGDALNFDGSFYVQIPNDPAFNISDNITLAAWISVDAFNQAWQTMFCRGDWSWRLHRESTTDYACFHMTGLANGWGADGATTDILVPKRWLHLVGTYKNGVGATLYINGAVEAVNNSVTGLINTSGNDPVTIGAWINNGVLSRQWLGQIDEVRLYNRALSPSDVSELYHFALTNYNNRPAITVPSGLVLESAPTNLQLTATASDDGLPLPANPSNPDPNDPNKLGWGWSVVSVPAGSAGVVWSGNPTNGGAFTYQGSPNPPYTVFTCNPTASFDVPGIYALNFSASDGQKASSRNVSVWVHSRNDYRPLGYMYLSPLPAAEYTSPQTRFVLVRFQNISPTAITNLSTFIQVTGGSSGPHAGQTKIAGDGRTISFQMSTDFTPNELVTVSLAPGVPPASGGPIASYQYQFVVSGHLPGAAAAPVAVASPPPNVWQPDVPPPAALDLNAASVGVAGIMSNGVSVPSDFPWINITTNNNPDPDLIFIDNRGGGGDPFNVIFNNDGTPVWYMRMPDERRDMKVQHNGVLTMLARDGGNHFNGFNTHYQQIAQYWAVNGYGVDEHELQVLPDGTYLLVALGTETVDMSRYVVGGNTAASVTEQVIQEFTPAGELIFQWRSWDHFDVRDQQDFINIQGSGFDFTHINAIDIDTDGHILISSRNTSEITKINRDTGEIIWRLGGAHNQFTFVNDPLNGTRNQHAIRMVTTNDYTAFDNGNLHNPSMSRAVEYVLDPTSLTATLVWQYPNPPTPSIFSFYMGDAQRLTNGNTLIDWAIGSLPKLTEVRPDGSKAYEMNWVAQWEAYRTWRCAWQGSALQPYLIAEPYPDNITLIFNQFGDTNVGFYKIYGGTVSQSTNLLAESGITLKRLVNLQNGRTYYFRVTAVNKQGVEGPFSNEATATANIIKPGQNMIQNGDFSQGTSSWVWTLNGGATAAWAIESGVSHIYITNATTTLANIQLKQTGKPIVLGKKYVFEFDAWAAQSRYIQAKVAQDAAPNLNYSGTTSTFLTPVRTHYRYVFTMNAPTDFNASVFFNLGGAAADVYLDNVSLFNSPPGDINLDGRVDFLDLQLLTRDWLKQQSGLSTDLDGNGKVDFFDFGILGENWSGNN